MLSKLEKPVEANQVTLCRISNTTARVTSSISPVSQRPLNTPKINLIRSELNCMRYIMNL